MTSKSLLRPDGDTGNPENSSMAPEATNSSYDIGNTQFLQRMAIHCPTPMKLRPQKLNHPQTKVHSLQ
jgi:hypothetical protein